MEQPSQGRNTGSNPVGSAICQALNGQANLVASARTNLKRWNALLRQLGIPPESKTFTRLLSAYAEGHRAYHSLRHIDECLSLFDKLKPLCVRLAEAECGLWFHDAIYESTSFLDRLRIYQCEPLFARFEEKARVNLTGAIRALTDGSGT